MPFLPTQGSSNQPLPRTRLSRQDKTRQDKVINHFQDQEDGGNITVYNKDNGNDNDEVDSYDDELSHALKSNFNQIN